MDVSEVLARPDGKGVAQTNWSGCAPLEANLTLADGHKLSDLLPNRRSDNQYLCIRFCKAAARFQRYLRQDDFGPTRADQIAALNLNLKDIGHLEELLRSISPIQAGLLCSRLDEELRPLVNLTWDRIFDAIHDTSDYLGHLDPVLVDPFLELADASNRFVDFPARIDTNTAARLVDEQGNFELHLPDRPLAIADVLDWIGRFRDIHEAQRIHCRSRKGFEKSDALYFLVWELARIWSYETGEAVTHYAWKHDVHTGRPETAAGTFILTAVEMMLPPAEIFPKDFLDSLNRRPRIFADSRNGLPSAVANALKRYVKEEVKPARAGRKSQAK
jgi:hypothetical protein